MSKVNTPEFRVAFPQVFQPKKNDLNGKDEYSIVALFPKGADLNVLKKAAQEALTKKFGADRAKWPKKLRSPFRDQGDREKEKEGVMTLPQGYEKGAIYLNLRSSQRPGLVDTQVQEIIDTAEFYGNGFGHDVEGLCINGKTVFFKGKIQQNREHEVWKEKTRKENAEEYEKLMEAGLLLDEKGRLRLSDEGFYLADEIALRLLK